MEFIKSVIRHPFISSSALSMGATWGYIEYMEIERYNRMERNFHKGVIISRRNETYDRVSYVTRPDIEGELIKVLHPSSSGRYFIVRGEVGCGKTRTIREMVKKQMDESKHSGAPIYVLANQGQSFVDSLATAVDFRFDEHLSVKYLLESLTGIRALPAKNDKEKLSRTLNAIEIAATKYRKLHNRPVVIVLDGIDKLKDRLPCCIDRLQEKAKLWADSGIVKMVFVSSDENLEKIMQRNQSEWSRAAAPVYISDLTREQALKVLNQDGRKIFTDEETEDVLQTVGHRVKHLLEVVQDRKDGIDLKLSLEKLKAKERTKLRFIPVNDRIMEILRQIYDAGTDGISFPIFSFFDEDMKPYISLATADILRIETRPTTTVIKFESGLTRTIVTEILQYKNKRYHANLKEEDEEFNLK